ncbi:MAG: S8 family serine peptidase [Phycisphaerae bacterium]
MRTMLWVILGICVAAVAAGVAPALLQAPAAENVSILIVDDFAYKPHGASVERVTRMWNTAGAEVRGIYAMNTFEGYLAGVEQALRFVRENPDRNCVVNLSLGHPDSRGNERELFDRLTELGAVVVASAGNESTDTPYYPSAYEGVLCVAAAEGERKADYSNFGPHVDVAVSPQQLMHVEVRRRWTPDGLIVHEIVRTESGTSLAAPKLAALLADLWARRPALTAEELVSQLPAYCRSMDDPHYIRGQLGSGLLDERRMLLEVPRYAARYAQAIASAVATVLAALLLIATVLLLGPALAVRATTAVMLGTVAIVLLTAELPWLLRWGWMVQTGMTVVSALLLISAGVSWPWPLGQVRVSVIYRPGLEDHGERLAKRLRRLGADVRMERPRSLVHAVFLLEETDKRPMCRLAVRDGLCYRLREFPADMRWWTGVAVEAIRAERRQGEDFPDI